jgi:hypothetical protein
MSKSDKSDFNGGEGKEAVVPNPHGEEPRSGVSNHESPYAAILRDAGFACSSG